ncbi:hypothetical protein DL93DRAFT_2080912 [Clavulina sp. PMI_390]|nr:hypothetical protein DL93DRAFT_2080912 [Clavulina sp. PMI_390]
MDAARRLPAEVLSQIFYLVIRSIGGDEPEWSTFRQTWRALLFTSRTWNELVMNNPILWSEAHFASEPEWMSEMLSVFLVRSKNVPLDVYIHQAASLRRGTRIAERGQELEGISQASLLNHFERFRLLYFSCPPSPFFPLSKPTPKLTHLIIASSSRVLWGSRGLPDHILHSPSPLEVLHVGWPAPSDPFQHVDPQKLRRLSFSRSWEDKQGPHFLSSCKNLTRLHLPYDGLKFLTAPPSLDDPLHFPHLESLRLHDACELLSLYFGPLPSLLDLTIVSRHHYSETNTFAPRFGGRTNNDTKIAPPWPTMPRLKHLTVQHVHAEDLIPVFASSPDLLTARIYVNVGLSEFLHCLENKWTLPHASGADNQAVDGKEHSERAHTYQTLVPNLASLLLFPNANESAADLTPFGHEEAIGEILPLIDTVLDGRPGLTIEIGDDESDGGGGNCAGRWRKADLMPFVQNADLDMGVESSPVRLRNASRVIVVPLTYPPYAEVDPPYFDL